MKVTIDGEYTITELDSGHVIMEVTTPPDAPLLDVPVRILSKLDYMNRFTDAELAGIYTAAKSVVAVEILLEKFKMASDINLDDPSTVVGLQTMSKVGLIASGRVDEILA